MEQRWSPRTRVDLDVDLSYGSEELMGCKTRDIGMGGVFIELADDKKPSEETVVDVVFKIAEGQELTQHRIKATVVRNNEHGIGLMFRDFDANTFRSLQEVLHHVQSNSLH